MNVIGERECQIYEQRLERDRCSLERNIFYQSYVPFFTFHKRDDIKSDKMIGYYPTQDEAEYALTKQAKLFQKKWVQDHPLSAKVAEKLRNEDIIPRHNFKKYMDNAQDAEHLFDSLTYAHTQGAETWENVWEAFERVCEFYKCSPEMITSVRGILQGQHDWRRLASPALQNQLELITACQKEDFEHAAQLRDFF